MIVKFDLNKMSAELGLPPAVVALWAADGKIPSSMVDGCLLFDPEQVQRHIERELNKLNEIDDGSATNTDTK
jgi:hypothetical protein